MEIFAVDGLGRIKPLSSFKEANNVLQDSVYKYVIYRESPCATIKLYNYENKTNNNYKNL